MNKSVRIRWLCGTQRLGEIGDLPLDQAADLIAQGQVEPDITIRDHNPPVPSEGLSLAEAFEVFVNQHPDLTQYGDVRLRCSKIALQQYVEQPTWSGTADVIKLRHLAGLKPLVAPEDQGRRGGPGMRVIRHGKLEIELTSQLQRFVLRLVIHRFVQGLFDGHLHATGVWQGDLATLKRQRVPSDWWKRDIIVHVRSCDIWERTARDRPPGLRGWTAVQVIPIDTEAFGDETDTSVPLSTGAPGRPSSMHLIEREFRRRAELGLLDPNLTAQAKALAEWVKENHPKAPPATANTIANRLRPLYRSLKGKTKS